MSQKNFLAPKIKMPVGVSSFEQIRKDDFYYLDKTNLIADLVNSSAKVTLFTRPRRFGKTLTMNMLESFFNIEKDSCALFADLDIGKKRAICEKWQNQYPIVYLTFKEVEGLDFEEAYEYLQELVSDLFNTYDFLLEMDDIKENDRKQFIKFKSCEFTKVGIKKSLKLLTKLLRKYYGKRVILLFDEYDVPLAKASENGYYREMLDVLRGILQVLKDNEYLEFAVITGCLRISKESIFTGTNNFKVNTITSSRFNEYFGFTEKEVKQLLKDAKASTQYSVVKEWYDGYNFGGTDIYCPWDVINYVDDFLNGEEDIPKCYWNNTSGNAIIRTFIDKYGDEIREDFEALLAGKAIQMPIREDLTYELLHSSVNNFWSILYLTGYITKIKTEKTISGQMLLRIPNKEVKEIFKSSIEEWFIDIAPTLDRHKFFKAVWERNPDIISSELSHILTQTISYYDYKENFYHAFLAGIFAGVGHVVKSNYENGEGRSDIAIKDNKNSRVVIFEVKHSETEKNMEADCEKALKQIKEKKYAQAFMDDYAEVICYGIAFYKKRCRVKF